MPAVEYKGDDEQASSDVSRIVYIEVHSSFCDYESNRVLLATLKSNMNAHARHPLHEGLARAWPSIFT